MLRSKGGKKMIMYLIGIILLITTLFVVTKAPVLARIIMVIFLSLVIGVGTYSVTSVSTHRYYHGAMNTGIGWPYKKLMSYLNDLAQQKQYDKLEKALGRLDAQSRDIFDVWLDKHNTLRFSNIVDDIAKK
jgi:hypothetical protein